METKCIEVRDEGTTIAALALHMLASDPVEHTFFWREGYPQDLVGGAEPSVVLMALSNQRATSDPYEWGNRTMRAAHMWLIEHWGAVENGQVVDVRVILGETDTPANPEIVRKS